MCVCGCVFWQVNRRQRAHDEFEGKMVGLGHHYSYDELVEPFKPEKLGERERKRRCTDDQASVIHIFEGKLNATAHRMS